MVAEQKGREIIMVGSKVKIARIPDGYSRIYKSLGLHIGRKGTVEELKKNEENILLSQVLFRKDHRVLIPKLSLRLA